MISSCCKNCFASLLLSMGLLAQNSVFESECMAAIDIQTPSGGWRNTANDKLRFTQEVNYPASSVNIDGQQSKAAMIRGKVTGMQKDSAPYTLNVNGITMPLKVEANSFARPYMFGAGSNGVEVRSPNGKERTRVQFYEANSHVSQPRLTVLMAWDSDNTDIDLHVISPDGQHAWYGERVTKNGGAIDVDVTTGYGPEIFSTPSPVKGNYLVFANYYGAGSVNDLTTVKVTVVQNQNTVDERIEDFTVPLRRPGDVTLVHSFLVQ
ncbi:MAG: DUF2135 domain-containing protein [Proteobacteria bacterium]|nr:DUF2135 domain-containing protein [Pseudomonadota bacterium]